ncbi:hypothetical protein [Bernardetia sp. MNP-M8]|uniref:hypothetical protein n=1 Tax=Bernardetia sp. MNP-M8 TaxID=3127470 RepID=UPI0030CB298E
MSEYQLPPLKDEKKFEEFICDLFNEIEKTKSYSNTSFQTFGVKGQYQKGIDIFSYETNTVIQCKLKDISKKDDAIRKDIKADIDKDLGKIKNLQFDFDRLIFISTFRDDTHLEEYTKKIKQERNLNFRLEYWGWDTIQRYLKGKKNLLEKYYSDFIIEQSSEEATFLRNLSLKKKIEKDFKDWLSYSPRNWKRRGRMIIRSLKDNQCPDNNEPNEYGEYSYFKAEIKSLYHNGMEFIYYPLAKIIRVFEDGSWTSNLDKEDEKFDEIGVWEVGQINFSDIVGYDMDGNGIDNCPHIVCKFNYRGLPFESTYFWAKEKNLKFHFENAR